MKTVTGKEGFDTFSIIRPHDSLLTWNSKHLRTFREILEEVRGLK